MSGGRLQADWDPDAESDRNQPPQRPALKRMTGDVAALIEAPLPGIVVFPTSDARHVFALITGPEGTPYESAPFIVKVLFPRDYPLVPPKVKWLTTGGGAVRMGPNLYANGKVCLSILGTWHGPSWLPAQSLSSVLLSIQSLMGEDAARNEPGHEAASEEEVGRLNDVLAHEVLRVSVLEQARAGAPGLPAEVQEQVVEAFRDLWEVHAERARELGRRLDGRPFAEPGYAMVVGGARKFRFGEVAKGIEDLARALPPRREEGEGEEEEGAGGGGGGGGGPAAAQGAPAAAGGAPEAGGGAPT